MKPNPDLTFGTLIPTTGNRATLEACMAFAASERPRSNPLILHGPTAVGKTYVLHAIANELDCYHPESKVCLTTCEKWTDELVSAIRAEQSEEFRDKYRRLDVLLMDDVQVLREKKITQCELNDCITALVLAGARVTIAHSGPLAAIPFLILVDQEKPGNERRHVLEMRPPTTEEMISMVSRRFATTLPGISLDLVRAACEYAGPDIRRAEGRLSSLVFRGREFSGDSESFPS